MLLPLGLETVLDQATQAVLAHPQHALVPCYRMRIYDAFTAETDARPWAVRGTLGVLAVRWAAVHVPHEPHGRLSPNQILALAIATFRGTTPTELARTTAIQWQQDVDVLISGVEPVTREEMFRTNWNAPGATSRLQPVAIASSRMNYYWLLFISVLVLLEVLGDQNLEGFGSPQLTDADVDPWGSDSAGQISHLHAGGVWNPASDPKKRQEFWTWWLREAIPGAWEQAQVGGDIP